MKALSLFSGGLDSQLAVCLIKQQGIDVVGINFVTPFFGANDRTIKAADDLDIKLLTPDISDIYIPKVLRNPVYGYGKNFNPCIDCHGFMLRLAGEMMPELGASFLITGEVVGQRPMSQNKSAMNAVVKLSGQRGFIVRPLTAKLLEPSEPEKRGWIDRDRLLDISGRSRTRQMELAEQLGITDYPSPAGGCLLTDAGYTNRLRRYFGFSADPHPTELAVLKLGRHFYLNDGLLLIVGRNQSENNLIRNNILPGDYLLKVMERPGPLAMLRSPAMVSQEDLARAASIVARYSDARDLDSVMVRVFSPDSENEQMLSVAPMPADVVTSAGSV
ncbi:MAG: tRNA 4-thiouridine(8) synthase ThiI [Deltaproteobacteria bacterium]